MKRNFKTTSKLIYLLALLFVTISCNETVNSDLSGALSGELATGDREELLKTFMLTQDAWNEGSLENFMYGYWESDKLVFTGAGGPTYGYDATLERYKKGYPDLETMGKLKFDVIDLYKIDTKTAVMIGKFHLTRTVGDMQGYYTLIWQKIDGRWLIISDHSSSEPSVPTE